MKRQYISLLVVALLACSPLAGQEQELNKEITIDSQFVPVEQKASKSNQLPDVYRPQSSSTAGTISYSDWAVPADVPSSVVTLSPYGYQTSREFSTNRGYFDFGIGTRLDMMGSAGYRVIDFDRTKLGIWLQHNSTWTGHNKSVNSPFSIEQHWNDNVLGIDFSHRFDKGTLSANAYYHYDNFNYFGRVVDKWPGVDSTQSVNEFRIDVGWRGPFHEAEGLNYSFRVMYNYFGFGNDVLNPIQGNSENHLRVQFGGEFASSEYSHIGLDLKYDYINYNIHHFNTLEETSSVGHENMGLFKIMPYYAYRSGRMSIKAGVHLDVSFNDGAVFRVAPHFEFRYDLLRGLQFYVEADGGKMANSLSRMFAANRYISPQMLPANPYTPLDVQGGFKIGPFAGFNATVYGGWAKVKDTMMPMLSVGQNISTAEATYNCSMSRYFTLDMKGWRAGGELAYAFRTLADASVSLEYSPQDNEQGYIFGDDRAELVLNAIVKFHPIKKLTVGIGYQLRSRRSLMFTDVNGMWYKQELQDVNSLKLGANYRLNDIVGFFVELDNLLNKRWDTHYGMGTQPLGVMGGVSLLF